MSSIMRGVSLILIAALLSQTAGCYTTRIQTTRGGKIKREMLQEGMMVYMTLRPESGLLKSGKIVREFECVINRVDPKNKTIVVVAFNEIHVIETFVIQKMEVIWPNDEAKVLEKGKTALLIGGTIVGIVIIAGAIFLAVAIFGGLGDYGGL